MSSNDQADAVRRWVCDSITDTLDNDEPCYLRLTGVAADAVLNGMGVGTNDKRRDYEMMLLRGTRRQEYADAVGSAVRDELREIIDESIPGDSAMHDLMIAVLDLSDSAQAALLGDHYLPESADDIEWND